MYIPGAALDNWPELKAAIEKQAKLKRQQRELGQKLNDLEGEQRQLEELFVREAQDLYERMSEGDLDSTKAEKQANKAADELKAKLAGVETERADVQRRLEALRRSLQASDGQIEMVLKTGAPEQMERITGQLLTATQDLEQVIFQAQEQAQAARDQYQAVQYIDQYLGRNGSVAPRQIGPNGSFGSGPESALMQTQRRTQELAGEIGRIRAVLHGEDAQAVPAIGENVTVTRSGTVGIITDDD